MANLVVRYEYHQENVPPGGVISAARLAYLGKDGWDLRSIVGTRYGDTYIFVRPVWIDTRRDPHLVQE